MPSRGAPPDKCTDRGERIRIAFCVDNLNIGGTELNAVRTAERLDPARFELCVACLQPEGPLAERYAAAGISVHVFPIASLYGARTLHQGMRLARFLREQRVDVLHAHDKYSNMFAVPWARLAGVKVIASRRWWGGEARVGHRALNRWSYKFSHAVLANSERVGEMVTRLEGVPRERMAVVPNFVDPESFCTPSPDAVRAFRNALNVPPQARLVGIVANLRPVKDQASLLRALSFLAPRWPDVHLVLVGEGESRGDLEALARELCLEEKVHFAGKRPNLPNLHHMFEVSVLCSLSEGLSNSLLEAMAAGRPLVATDVGAASDAILHGETGLLVPRADPERLAGALDVLLKDPERARQMGAAGRHRARSVYSPEAALNRLYELYTRLAGDGAATTPAGRFTPPPPHG